MSYSVTLKAATRAATRAAIATGMTIGACASFAAPLPAGWTSTGNAGTNTAADGVVTLAPGFDSYQWVSSEDGVDDGGDLPVAGDLVGNETNGSQASTPIFDYLAGDDLNFFFNYITSDGSSSFTDYAWAALFTESGAFDRYIFTARTTPEGDTVPGFGLPPLGAGASLNPAATPIIAGSVAAGGPAFSPLGGSSGDCFAVGCGHTGWIGLDFTFSAAGSGFLGFGVTNVSDTGFDSALAVAGVSINDVPIEPPIEPPMGVPVPGTIALLGLGLAGIGWRRRKEA